MVVDEVDVLAQQKFRAKLEISIFGLAPGSESSIFGRRALMLYYSARGDNSL